MGIADFYVLGAAVLVGNLLAGSFFWGLMQYSRRERQGTENLPGTGLYLTAIILPLVFLAGGVFFATVKPSPTMQELMIDSAARLATENPPAASQ